MKYLIIAKYNVNFFLAPCGLRPKAISILGKDMASSITTFHRTAEELLEAFDAASAMRPLILSSNEVDTLSGALAKRNQYAKPSDFKINIRDKEVSFKEGSVFSHADQKHYSNRKDWDNHLKQHGCIEVGNEKPKERKRAIQGDFNCRKELTEATRQVLRGN